MKWIDALIVQLETERDILTAQIAILQEQVSEMENVLNDLRKRYSVELAEAKELGRNAGSNAASWVVDSSSDRSTYERILKGLVDGDPEVLDALPHSPLSGEWAGEPTPKTLMADLGLNTGDEPDWLEDEICTAYEDGFSEGVHAEVERVCRYHLTD